MPVFFITSEVILDIADESTLGHLSQMSLHLAGSSRSNMTTYEITYQAMVLKIP